MINGILHYTRFTIFRLKKEKGNKNNFLKYILRWEFNKNLYIFYVVANLHKCLTEFYR